MIHYIHDTYFMQKQGSAQIFYINHIHFKSKPTAQLLKMPKKLQKDPKSLLPAAGHPRAAAHSPPHPEFALFRLIL